MNDLLLLWRLQSLENELEMIKTEEFRNEKKKNIKYLKSEYEDFKESLHKKIDQYKELEKKITRDHLKNKNLSYEVKELQDKLYDGSIKDFKVYSQMEKELQEFKTELDTIENHLICFMDEKDLLEKDIKKIKKYLIKLHEQFQQEKNLYSTKKEELQSQYRIKTHEIESLLADIQDTAIIEYRDIQKRVQPALAKIEKGVCTGCHMNVSIILLKEIQEDEKLYTCESCGRILYLE